MKLIHSTFFSYSSLYIVIIFILSCAIAGYQCLGSNFVNGTVVLETARSMDSCFMAASPTFLTKPQSNLPTSTGELKRSCEVQANALKCLKEKSKGTSYLIKRGVGSFITSRQRHTRKYCANVNSELSQRYVKDLKCIIDKKYAQYLQRDIKFGNSFKALLDQRGKFADAATELKHLCCSMITFKRDMIDLASPECASSKASIEELYGSLITGELNLVCEEEEKLLSKVCPSLPPLANVSTVYVESPGNGPSTLGIYLFATLGDGASPSSKEDSRE